MNKKIAIIIPAYKNNFLAQTLDSIVAQTNHSFTVYIGDDASPHDLQQIIDRYKTKIDIVYHRFETNLGHTDLISHWARCIALSKEKIIWFFSDDDIMPADGIERILAALQAYTETDHILFRFPLAVINSQNEIIRQNAPFKEMGTDGYHFLLDKLKGKIDSAACEYVFSRYTYEQTGGFVNFPLAWCSDDATWAKFADYTGKITALPGKPVYWRNADGQNISNSNRYDREKLKATQQFLCWIKQHYCVHSGQKELRKALTTYIHTILCDSLRGNFTLRDLYHTCYILYSIDPQAAFKVALRHLKKSKLCIK